MVMVMFCCRFVFFFFNDTATTEIYTLSLHDALPIWASWSLTPRSEARRLTWPRRRRSEEHTSELQSHSDLVCRLLLEKKKKPNNVIAVYHAVGSWAIDNAGFVGREDR